MEKIKFVKLNKSAFTPTRGSKKAAGSDLYSVENITLLPGEIKLIKTGIAVAINEGYYGRVAPRSGLALKNGIDVMAGVVDADYRGELGVVLINLHKTNDFKIEPGMRIAQIIIEKCEDVEWQESESLDDTERGEKGYGSSGK